MISTSAEKIGLTPDLIQAEHYLSILDEGAETFCFQTFDDLKSRKSKALVSIRQGSFEKWGAFLAQMNNSGGGVFVTVNESDGQGRKLENITRIRTIWHEEDTPCNKQFPLEPHLLIESSPGKYHRYWLVDGLSQPDFSGVMRRMIEDYGSDPNVKDTARVLRIPGFYHQKDPEYPFMVRIISESGGLPYSAETIMKAFPPLEAAQVIPMHRTTEALNDGATKALVAELASRASRRTHEDPHKGRHTQVLWLGFECAARGVQIDYAEYAIKVFSRLMRQTDTTGKPTAINFESEVTAFRKSYAKGINKRPSAIERYELPVAQPPDEEIPPMLDSVTRKSFEVELETAGSDIDQVLRITASLQLSALHKAEIELLLKRAAKAVGVSVDSLRNRRKLGPPGGSGSNAGTDDFVEELNNRHAIVPIAGRVLVMNQEWDPALERNMVTFSSSQDLQLRYFNQKTWAKGKEVDIASAWLEHPMRRQYEGVVFAPQKDVSEYFNLFQGFGIDPKPGDCTYFKKFIFEVICSEIKELFDYMWLWLAHLFQKPAELPGTAFVLRGKQGVGKNTFVDALGILVGAGHYIQLSNIQQVTGRFSGHLADTLLVFANEAIWGGDKTAEGSLKHMVTDPITAIERKGRDIIAMNNYKRLIAASNEDWVIPRGLDDRRFIIVDVSDEYKENHPYFARIKKELVNGGYQALMAELLAVDLSDYEPRTVPEQIKEIGWELKIRSGGSIVQWWYSVLAEGCLWEIVGYNNEPVISWPEEEQKTDVYNHYLGFCKKLNVIHPEIECVLGKKLKNWGVDTEQSRKNNRKRTFKFPPLPVCRELFSVICSIPMVEWE